jgi:hypothetical protein
MPAPNSSFSGVCVVRTVQIRGGQRVSNPTSGDAAYWTEGSGYFGLVGKGLAVVEAESVT